MVLPLILNNQNGCLFTMFERQ